MSTFFSFVLPSFFSRKIFHAITAVIVVSSLFSSASVIAQITTAPSKQVIPVVAKVNINTATSDQIASKLVGVGTVKAQAIVAYRVKHGKFKTMDALTLVKGIGEATVEKNRAHISL